MIQSTIKGQCVGIEAIQFWVISLPVKLLHNHNYMHFMAKAGIAGSTLIHQ